VLPSASAVHPLRLGRRVRVALLLMNAVSAGAFACILVLPAHSLATQANWFIEQRKR
jgi:hypothetical protein